MIPGVQHGWHLHQGGDPFLVVAIPVDGAAGVAL